MGVVRSSAVGRRDDDAPTASGKYARPSPALIPHPADQKNSIHRRSSTAGQVLSGKARYSKKKHPGQSKWIDPDVFMFSPLAVSQISN